MTKKVLFVITGLGLGGAESQMVKIALGLKRRSWEVNVYSLLSPSYFVNGLENEGIKVYSSCLSRKKSFRFLQFLRVLKNLYRVVKFTKPDAVICFMFHANLVGRIVGRYFGIPVISSIRTEKYDCLKRFFTKATDRMSVVTVFNSRIVAEKAITLKYVKQIKARVIPNGIQIERFQYLNHFENRRKLTKELLLDTSTFIWIAIGRLEKPKDYPNLLNAFKIVLDHREDTVLLIAGEGSERSTIESIVREFGISERVKLIGERRDVPELLSASDAFVLSSSLEGLPNALIEALASGLPVVATDVGGVRELVDDSIECGYIVPSENAEALGEAMLHLMKQVSSELRIMGENGRKKVLHSYGLSNTIDAYEQLLIRFLK